jgi:phosphoribosylanthranilate isomerase
MTKIKICGITNLEDALAAANAGADMIGFIFAESPRKVSTDIVKKISDLLPMTTAKVGVFVDAPFKTVNAVADECHLDYVQLYGNDDKKYLEQITTPIIKAIRVKDRASLAIMQEFTPALFLLDTYDKHKAGGTGRTFDWSLAIEAKSSTSVPIILSGGLNLDNISEAISTVRPYAVDVNSGIESSPGKKDLSKLRKIVYLAHLR